MSSLVVPLLAACLLAVGLGALRSIGVAGVAGVAATPTFALGAGAVVFHVLLQLESLAGIPWHWTHVLLLAALGAAIFWRARRAERKAAVQGRPPCERGAFGWGDGVAVVVLLVLATLCARAVIDNPDFIYHWGAKGRKFAEAAGFDLVFLGPPSGWHLHPDYPNLLPELFALTAAASKTATTASASPLLLWTAIFCAALLAAARDALDEAAAGARQIALACTSLALLAAAFALELGGNADPLIAWALLLGLPALLAPRTHAAPARAGVAAALAASSKIEGVPLALFLIAAFLLAERTALGSPDAPRDAGRGRWGRVATLVLPAGLVTAPWLWINLRHALFSAGNTGAPSLARLGLALPEIGKVFWSPLWSGLPLTLLVLPWLVARRRTRWAAAVCAAQLVFYLWVYGTAPVDAVRYVQWSFARLLLHVLPAVWVLCALAWTEEQPVVARSG